MNYNKVHAGLGGFDIFSPKVFRIHLPTIGTIQFFATPSFDDAKEYIIFGKGDHSGTEGSFKISTITDIYTLEDITFGNITHITIEI